jgi:hypothetical protein
MRNEVSIYLEIYSVYLEIYEYGELYPLCSLAILNLFLLMKTRFRSGRNCSGLGGAAAGIESIVSMELPVQHSLQKCSPTANRSQGQRTMPKTED